LAAPVEPERTDSAALGNPTEAPPADSPTAKKQRSPEVERMIARLLEMKASRASGDQKTPPAQPRVSATPAASSSSAPKASVATAASSPSAGTSASSIRPSRAESEAKSASAAKEPAARFTGIDRETPFSNDPSFVFFRQIPDAADAGPVGALGVPLTPGRSVAVDPRTTPLGSPVFISTEGQSAETRFNRLMFAQDTGGAIRGAVRADFFWGFGPNAFARASRMRESGRMWLLLPKDLRVAASQPRTRGIGGKPGANETDCLVPDPEFCVE
jgi:membrane-bound lytic murein transglycosylase A